MIGSWQEFNSYPFDGAQDGILAVSSDGRIILCDLNDKGLFCSSDKTMSWEKIELPIIESNFNGSAIRTTALLSNRMNENWFYLFWNCLQFSFGKPLKNGDPATIFVYGKISSISGFFRFDNLGKTWMIINKNINQFSLIESAMTGCRQMFGRMYISCREQGEFYGQPLDN